MKDAGQELLAWDQSLQDTIRTRLGENVRHHVEDRIAGAVDANGVIDKHQLRNLAEVLERNIVLAERVRDRIRQEIFDLGQQRRCVAAGVRETRPSRSFVA